MNSLYQYWQRGPTRAGPLRCGDVMVTTIRIGAEGTYTGWSSSLGVKRGCDPFGLGQRGLTWQILFATLVRNTTWVDIVEQYIGLGRGESDGLEKES